MRRPPGGVTVAVVLALGAWASTTIASREPPSRRLSIVLITVDDLGYGDVGAYGGTTIPTPNIDAMAREGVRFGSAYAPAPMCSPSRAAILTGRYPQRFGLELNVGDARQVSRGVMGIPATEITLATLLQQAGYRTGLVGKWHLGFQPAFHPTKHGFDEFFGFLHALYRRPGAHGTREPEPVGAAQKPGTQAAGSDEDEEDASPEAPTSTIYRNTTPVEERRYLTDAFAHEAGAFIERHRRDRFFLQVAFNAPHAPLHATERYLARFASVADPRRRTYAAMVSAVDEAVGAIVRKLRDAGLDEETAVIFLSDNGCPGGTSPCSNGPLHGGKFTLFEGGIRVPLVMRLRGSLPGGQVFDKPVSALDVFPTAAALAGVALPADRPIDGVNLLPHLTAATDPPPHPALFWKHGQRRAVRQDRWKLIRVEEEQWLFDLDADPGELRDLSASQPEIVARLERAFLAWERDILPPRPGPAGRRRP